MRGARASRLRKQNHRAAYCFICFLLLLPIVTTQAADREAETAHVREEDSRSSPVRLLVGGVPRKLIDDAAVPVRAPFARQVGGGERQQQQLSRLLGSRPPCCERKCRGCAPCRAVQVRAGAALRPQCANYEPVGWKCKCGAALFDP